MQMLIDISVGWLEITRYRVNRWKCVAPNFKEIYSMEDLKCKFFGLINKQVNKYIINNVIINVIFFFLLCFRLCCDIIFII